MKRIEIIRKHWGKKSYTEIAKLTGQSSEGVRKMGRKDGLPPYKRNSQNEELTPHEEIARDVKVASLSSAKSKTEQKYKIVADENETLKAMLEAMKVSRTAKIYQIQSKRKGVEQGATAVAVLSDVHFEETVHSSHVNEMNEYNVEIAKKRVELFFVNLVKLVKIFGKESKIENLILALLGDLINGQLREEAMENNSLRPINAMLEVQTVIASGIQYVLDNTDLILKVPCCSGNHGRITKKLHVSTEAGNSLEYALYCGLAHQFKENKRVEFLIPESYHCYVDVHGFMLRLHHGHSIRYAGGVAGIFLPVKKAIGQWNKQIKADLDVFGHMHQLRDGGDFVSNGSVIGFNEFANFIKADFEKPKQVFFLIDHKRKEKTVTCPIFLS